MTSYDALEAAWAQVRQPDSPAQFIHLTGAPGAGKSALVDRFIHRARTPLGEHVVLRARFGGPAEPLSRQRSLLEDLIEQIAEGARAIISGDEPFWALPSAAYLKSALGMSALPGGQPRARIFADLLLAITDYHPVCLALDEIDRADPRDKAIVEALIATAPARPSRLLLILVSADAIIDPQAAEVIGWRPPATRVVVPSAPFEVPALTATAYGDLQLLALSGPITASLLARARNAPVEQVTERLNALVAAGVAALTGPRYRVPTTGLATHLIGGLDAAAQRDAHVAIGVALLAAADAQLARITPPRLLDVTQTWREGRNTEARLNAALDALGRAIRHFAAADDGLQAAEAAVRLVERALTVGMLAPVLGGPGVRLADRARRRQLKAALEAARFELDQLDKTPHSQALHARHLAARGRFRAAMGDFRAAGQDVTSALTATCTSAGPTLRITVLRAQVEVFYASGRFIEGRAALLALIDATEAVLPEAAAEPLSWLVEVVGRWEWVGLHDRLLPFLIERIEARGLSLQAVQARIERLAAAVASRDEALTGTLLTATVELIAASPHVAEGADLLARCAADLVRDAVERHYDILSGEFFPADLEGSMPTSQAELRAQLALPVELFDHASTLAEQVDALGQARIYTRILHGIIDARERLLDLLDRWGPLQGDGPTPRRVLELSESLEQGFFNQETVQSLVDQVLAIAGPLGLHQLVADTAYEALERGLPGAQADPERYLRLAEQGYALLEDAYGACTLGLIQLRHAERAGHDPEPVIERITAILDAHGDSMSPEQRAYVRVRLGERLLLTSSTLPQATAHLELAVADYDQIGEVDQVQLIGGMLREVYRKLGDFGRYRALRTRFRALDARTPGADPLGLEMRIEHLLNQARREADPQKAIAMLERCVALFTRLSDGIPRVDECFVEISKICRRCADDAQTEAGFVEWVRRSLDAVRTAAGINKSLGNLHRLFEEYHELFDDLLAIGAMAEYQVARAEIRELAFDVGHLNELCVLFEEQLQPDIQGEPRNRAETQAFFTAL